MSLYFPGGRSQRATIAFRLASLAAPLLLFSFSVFGQTTCTPTSTAVLVHQEGLTERVGDIVLTCSGGTVGATVSLQLFLSTTANITNKQDANGRPTGITITGATLGQLNQTSATTLNLNAVNFMVAAGPTAITISGVRVAVAPLQSGTAPVTILATVVGVGAQFPSTTQLIVGISQPTLLASTINNGVPCAGSPLPSTLNFATFSTTSTSSSARVTEASNATFTPKDNGADSGMRVLLTISGYGANARVFVPDAVVGNSGTVPTSSGAFASTSAAGTYTPGGQGQLLLVRVNGADANGAGGTLAMTTPATATTFSSMTEVALTNGAATVAYEIVDSNAALQETVQIPAFVVTPATSCPSTLAPSLGVKLGPVSSVTTATATDPIPRFVSITPALDCTVKSDCSAFYFPQFTVDTTPISLSASSLGAQQTAFVKVGNVGPGVLNFTTSVSYGSGGSGWLSISPSTGTNNATLQVIANPGTLNPGTYTATITVSAAPYGSGTIPVTLTVGPVGVTIQNVGNAASFTYGTVAPGSYAVIFGLNLQGAGVTFNGLPANVIYSSPTQINAIVPATLGTQQNAAVIASANGTPSNSFQVGLALNAPGIFNPGIVNADGTINNAANPAPRGQYVAIYLTGFTIIGGNTTGTVTVNFGTLLNQPTLFAGAQPTLPALDQVNVTVPAALPATPNPVQVQVCIPGGSGQICSNQVPLYIK